MRARKADNLAKMMRASCIVAIVLSLLQHLVVGAENKAGGATCPELLTKEDWQANSKNGTAELAEWMPDPASANYKKMNSCSGNCMKAPEANCEGIKAALKYSGCMKTCDYDAVKVMMMLHVKQKEIDCKCNLFEGCKSCAKPEPKKTAAAAPADESGNSSNSSSSGNSSSGDASSGSSAAATTKAKASADGALQSTWYPAACLALLALARVL